MKAACLIGCMLAFACGDDSGPAGGGGGTAGANAGGAADGGAGAAGGGGAQAAGGGGAQAAGGDGGAGGAGALCDEAAFVGGGIAADGWGEGDFCDSVTACIPAPAMPSAEALFDDIVCKAGADCPNFCTLYGGGTITADQLEALCSATLIDGVTTLTCLVLGP